MELVLIKGVLVLLVVLYYTSCLGSAQPPGVCNEAPLPSGNGANHTLLVSATVSNSTITLACSISKMRYVSPSHYLKWSEKGRDLPFGDDTDRYSVTVDLNTGSTLLTIYNAGTADYGEYTCRCYNNVSVSGVVDISYTHTVDYVYHHHCSDPFTVVADPPDQVVNISNHVVQNKNEVVTLDCENENEPGLQLIYVTTNRTIDNNHLETPLSITVDSASEQGKYICIDGNSRLTQIHYVSIKDYEPPIFMLPTLSNNHPTIYTYDGTARIPVCAVYSTLPLKSYKFQSLLVGFNHHISTSESESNNGLHIMLYYNVPHYAECKCEFQTDWETIIFTDYNIATLARGDETPTACLWMTVEPFDVTDIKYGDSFTVLCNVFKRTSLMNADETIELLHTPIDRANSTISIQPQRAEHGITGHDVETYYFEFINVTELRFGEYMCRYTYGTTIEEEASIVIPIIVKPTVNTTFLSPPSSVDPSMTTPTTAPPSHQLQLASSYSAISTQPLSSIPSSSPLIIASQLPPASVSDASTIQVILISVAACSLVLIMIAVLAIIAGVISIYRSYKQGRRTEAVNRVSTEGGRGTEEPRYVVSDWFPVRSEKVSENTENILPNGNPNGCDSCQQST